MFRIGQGYDVHRLEKGRELWLGGVLIPHSSGLSGHSDADVLLHAICDAVLGAAGSGDIGHHFPDSDPAHRGRSSREFLKIVGEIAKAGGWSVSNIDATIIAEKPQLSPYVTEMCGNVAADLDLSPTQVNIKATTTEGLGFVGREEGIAALAVAMLTSETSG
ncbi:MAG TPA: 2-C-methyl-D-erythritol 2,4-cyclodiphosphate synthase [Gammaproteobacteria bacterium]|nr:2-C-methyl-D-erythritol 2,4-cyclodiphosphate synthase [Gammaproteobacteria bacterium]